jgi:hydroxyethylthiazole kinase-like uncharacterized protein yjeF
MRPPPSNGHPLLACSAIRALEARGLAATPPGTLMSRAADAIADACAAMLRALPARTPVLALIGPGNNGGDALLAAIRLAGRGWAVHGLGAPAAASPSAMDALRVREQWRALGRVLHGPDALEALCAERPLVIDGLFGIGLARPLPEAAARIARRVAELGLPVVAVDVPSGLDADRGSVVGGPDAVAFRADLTVTMVADKPGLRTGAGAALAGRVVVDDLGLPTLGIVPEPSAPPAHGAQPVGRLIDAAHAAALLPPARGRDAHKGRFGDVLVVSGATRMRGAATLAALGAQAAGAGRIYIGLDDATASADPGRPELMARTLEPSAGDAEGEFGPASALVVGCGLGRDAGASRRVASALEHPAALVLDADGLNAVAGDARLSDRLAARAARGRPSVLTPHPLEAARLLGVRTADVQADRIGSACRLAAASGACVVLKGAGTVVASPDGDWAINDSGGPILAVAGTGDVLSGAIAGLLAAGLPAAAAAACGVWIHGAAGDALAASPDWRGGVGLPASRLADSIRAVVNRRAGRS